MVGCLKRPTSTVFVLKCLISQVGKIKDISLSKNTSRKQHVMSITELTEKSSCEVGLESCPLSCPLSFPFLSFPVQPCPVPSPVSCPGGRCCSSSPGCRTKTGGGRVDTSPPSLLKGTQAAGRRTSSLVLASLLMLLCCGTQPARTFARL